MRNILRASFLGMCVWAMAACSGMGDPEVDQTEQAATCGPRNCVAFCVTCEYRACLAEGEPIDACKAARDLCVEDCHAHGHFLQNEAELDE